MPRFVYTARSATGQSIQATLDAPSRKDAARLLAARGLQPLRLEEAVSTPSAKSKSDKPTFSFSEPAAPKASGKFTPELQLPFLQALAELIGSGMPAGEAVRLLGQRLQEPRLRALCAALWDRLSEGLPLSQALESFPQVFDGHSVNLLAAGEATGNLREVLQRLIQHYTVQREMRRTIATALAYPLFICVVALGVILFFIFFLLPRLQTLLASLGGKLPWATRLLVGLSDFILHYGLFVVIATALTAIFFWRWRRSARGRELTDQWVLTVPFAGRFVTSSTIHNFSSTLAVLLENGVTTAEALRMTERTIANTSLRDAFRAATDRVLEGESLSQSLARTNCFPPLVIDRLAVGESTGQLGPSLRAIATSFQEELTRQIQLITQMISSGVLLFAFSFVAFIAYAIVSAVFQVSASFKF
ncbi:MAG: type II secretion system F family protein [Candidatus Didemnitutus sp.]|nr:type II secretion system F family protein [Candidatus Didemnitutus sp.]